MTFLYEPDGYARGVVLRRGREIVEGLVAEACDRTSDLSLRDRVALGVLALAVEVEVARIAGVPAAVEALSARLAAGVAP